MTNKIRVALHAVVNILGNLILLKVVPPQYEAIGLLAFNIAQVCLAYFDQTYALVKLGMKK